MFNHQFKDIKDQKFNRLLVIELSHMSEEGRAYWKCLCDCGNYTIILGKNLRNNSTRSCGCLQVESAKSRRKGYKEITGTFWKILTQGAKIRNLSVTITPKDLHDIFIKQNKKCALTGIPITLPQSRKDSESATCTASVDRIDSSKGYTIDNVQFVHKHINIMKRDHSQLYFINLCKQVAAYNE